MGVSNREVGASCSRGRGRGRGRGARTRTPSSSDRNPLPVSFGGDAMSSLCNTSNSRCSVVHDNIKLLSHNSDETSSQSSELQSQISTENGSIKSSCSVAYINDSVIAKEIGQSSRSSISSFRGSSDFESSLHEANISGCSLSSLSRSRVFPSTLTSDNRVKAINVIKTDRKLLSTSSHGAIYEPKPCIMAKKLPPAPQKVTVVVTTNIFPLDVENRIVYRYDVHMFSNRRHTSKKRFRDLCKGDRDEQLRVHDAAS
uniref:DUF1336 domain-containing protein n=1 Tax=Syphacia muris TaxID=451379 RepID=A0A0N5AXQ1_9BILA